MRDIPKVFTSPLQYVGGKYWAVRHILEWIPAGTTELVSPFFGGGCLDLNLAHYFGMQIDGSDKDAHLVNFWQHFLVDASGLVGRCKQILETHTREDLKALKAGFDEIPDAADRAAYYYVLNRLSFNGKASDRSYVNHFWKEGDTWWRRDRRRDSGWTAASFFGAYPSPFYLLYETYRSLSIELATADFETALRAKPGVLAYCDPPYPNTETLYSEGDGFDHDGLYRVLVERELWILSYQDVPKIRELYRDFHMMELERTGSFRKGGKCKKQKELLICSDAVSAQLPSQSVQLEFGW